MPAVPPLPKVKRVFQSADRTPGYADIPSPFASVDEVLAELYKKSWSPPKMKRPLTQDEIHELVREAYNAMRSDDGFLDKVDHPPEDLPEDEIHLYNHALLDRIGIDERKLYLTAYAIVVSSSQSNSTLTITNDWVA